MDDSSPSAQRDEGNDEIIDAIVKATFSEALRLISPYASGSATTPMEFWLIRLAEKNLKRRGAAPLGSGQAIDADAAQDRSDLARFRAALADVPERFRSVLVLAVVEQMPAADIAHCTGLSPAGAMRRLRAALKSAGAALEKQEIR
jgi:DNA-directed RNA polymerase specialized sigma24 family protein